MKVATFVVYNGLYHPLKPSINRITAAAKKVFDLLQDVDIIRRQAEIVKNAQRLGEGSVDGYFLDFSGRPKKISGWVLIITYLIELDHGFL